MTPRLASGVTLFREDSMARGFRTLLTAVAASVAFAAPASPADVVVYYHLDAIGNVRAVTNQAGQVIERHDYLPFGEECTTAPCTPLQTSNTRKFTGKERDAETGLDYFGARYYRSNLGRFTTVDPRINIRNSLLDPQRWNRYAYVSNNPLRYVDPDGREQPVIVGDKVYMGGLDAQSAGDESTRNVVFGGVVAGGAVATGGIVIVESGAAIWTAARIAAGTCTASPACRNAIQDLLEGVTGAPPGPRATEEFAEMAGMLRQAARGKGNFGVGSATAAQAEELGRAWVGEGATLARDGRTLVSADGLRQYRPPTYKPALGRTQANLEGRFQPQGGWQSNAHIDIKDKRP